MELMDWPLNGHIVYETVRKFSDLVKAINLMITKKNRKTFAILGTLKSYTNWRENSIANKEFNNSFKCKVDVLGDYTFRNYEFYANKPRSMCVGIVYRWAYGSM